MSAKHRATAAIALWGLAVLLTGCPGFASAQAAEADLLPVATVERLAPSKVAHASADRTQELRRSAERLDDWGGKQAWGDAAVEEDEQVALARVRTLIEAKRRVDVCLTEALSLRSQFAGAGNDPDRRAAIRQYLSQVSCLIDLSGRMRYVLRDAVDNAAFTIGSARRLQSLIDLLREQRSAVGGEVLAELLFEEETPSGEPMSEPIKSGILELIGDSGQVGSLRDVADFLRDRQAPARLVVRAAETIRQLGLPQDPLPSQDVKLNPPAILAPELKAILTRIPPQALRGDDDQRRRQLIAWLDERMAKGVVGDRYRVGDCEVQSGDWLLMRNPSPYNTFTDLAPGLFTHVGVVTVVRDDRGIRRFVIADLPERGERIPAETVDAYLFDTQHCIFLRHGDAEVAQAMGKAAADMIGNETQFDLLFDTSRVAELKGADLRGKRIHTYCAGFLLICAQQTGRPREEFFPVAEHRPGGHCQENLEKLGLAIGDDFVSPTGAIFSPHLEIVARREPIYDPARQVKEHIYDHFGRCMVEKKLTPAPDLYQSLRQTVADLSKNSGWLARALAKVNNVSPYMDLESAAKAAAVVETLDRIADDSRDGFLAARRAILAGPESEFAQQGYSSEEARRFRELRARHAALHRKWTAEEISPRQLRIALVEYYQALGRRRLEERFFND